MSDRECDVCGKSTPAFICTPCVRILRRDLVEAVWIERQRLEVVKRLNGGRRPVPGSRVLVNVDGRTLKRAKALHDELVAWVRLLSEEKAVTYPGNDETTQLAAWLAHNVTSIQYSEWAAEAWGNITDKVAYLRRCIDVPVTWLPLGQCNDGANGQGEEGCEGYVYYPPGKPEARCRECGAKFDVAERREWLISALGAWPLTAAQIEQLPPLMDGDRKIKAVTVRSWARRGQLFKLDDLDGDPRYKLNDVIALHARALAKVKG